MLDPARPTPSVEALLHAFLPAKFIDHTHADAVLARRRSARLGAARPRSLRRSRALHPLRDAGVRPREAGRGARARALRAGREPSVMVLDKHGIFTWGATAKESYERMIADVTRAERWLDARPAPRLATHDREPLARRVRAQSPRSFRGALARAAGQRWLCTFAHEPRAARASATATTSRASRRGAAPRPITCIRTKPRPARRSATSNPDDDTRRDHDRGRARRLRERVPRPTSGAARAAHRDTARELDPWPARRALPGPRRAHRRQDARGGEIAADIYEHTTGVIERRRGPRRLRARERARPLRRRVLEPRAGQARRRETPRPGPLVGTIALVTGAASRHRPRDRARAARAGAHVVLTDEDAAALERAAAPLVESFRQQRRRRSLAT